MTPHKTCILKKLLINIPCLKVETVSFINKTVFIKSILYVEFVVILLLKLLLNNEKIVMKQLGVLFVRFCYILYMHISKNRNNLFKQNYFNSSEKFLTLR